MKFDRYTIQGCCGKNQLVFKLDRPIALSLIETFKTNGFIEAAHFTKSGMLYVENVHLIISGPIGANSLNVKTKPSRGDVSVFLNDFEVFLTSLP
jgi:hypothetical protein